MKIDVDLETDCVYEEAHENYTLFCYGTGVLIGTSLSHDRGRTCPRCHGRGSMPTPEGWEIIRMVRHWQNVKDEEIG